MRQLTVKEKRRGEKTAEKNQSTFPSATVLQAVKGTWHQTRMMIDTKLPAAIVQLNKWKTSLNSSQFYPIWKKKKFMLKVPRLILRTANGNVAKRGKKPIFILFLIETSWSINFLSHFFPFLQWCPSNVTAAIRINSKTHGRYDLTWNFSYSRKQKTLTLSI